MDDAPDAMTVAAWQALAPWSEFRSDLVLTVTHVLTEPTCPIARVEFELERSGVKLNVACFGNTIQEAVENALKSAVNALRKAREKTDATEMP